MLSSMRELRALGPSRRRRMPRLRRSAIARPVSGQGTVFTYTVNYHAFNPELPTPYVIALVELAEQSGLRVQRISLTGT